MNRLDDAAVVETLRRHMSVAAAREMVAASNIANLNTPGYKAREVDFEVTLDRHLGGALRLAGADPGHLAGPDGGGDEQAGSGVRIREIADGQAQRDGNTVQLERELLAMGRAAGDFAQAQTALAAKFKLLRYAINEGR
ncbi:MAG: flagellar basal body rod protein FlgB [Acidobacteriota bacterium]